MRDLLQTSNLQTQLDNLVHIGPVRHVQASEGEDCQLLRSVQRASKKLIRQGRLRVPAAPFHILAESISRGEISSILLKHPSNAFASSGFTESPISLEILIQRLFSEDLSSGFR